MEQFRLKETYESVRNLAIDLEQRYQISIVRRDHQTVTVKQDDLDIHIDCVANGTSLGNQLAAAIKQAGIHAQSVTELRLEKLLELEEKHGFNINFLETGILLTHPEAEEGWSKSIDVRAIGEFIPKADYDKILELEKGNFPKFAVSSPMPRDESTMVEGTDEFSLPLSASLDEGSTDTALIIASTSPVQVSGVFELAALGDHKEEKDAREISTSTTAKKNLPSISLAEFQADPNAHLTAAQNGISSWEKLQRIQRSVWKAD